MSVVESDDRRKKHIAQQMPLIEYNSPTETRRSKPDLLESAHSALHAAFLVLLLGVPSLQNLLGAARLAAPLLCFCLQ